jgi:uncharacterized protein with HEPN domain
MLDAAEKVVHYMTGKTRQDLADDELLALALVRLLEIIGEAAKRVSEEARGTYSQIAWRQIGRTRDRLIHGYDSVDYDIVWSIVQQDIPVLIDQLKQISDGGRA